ncbi:MAG: GNAT family N-acetyltransferase [Henriciella sp.]|uniref:GNAT family N-acetyltransferase n=1 Tax=Henriciella sp. TaxID=1968823 RepID=UPI003C7881E0
MRFPEIGIGILRNPPSRADFGAFETRIVSDPGDFQKIACIRAVAFMGEQACPYEEEFDGNDYTSTHLIVLRHHEPVATLRLRWFAGFGKVERVCVIPRFRGTPAVKILIAHAFELAARKGYRRMIAQIQSRLTDLWWNTAHCRLVKDRPAFFFSDYEYREIELTVPVHPHAIHHLSDPYLLIRPEGDWDRKGVLERSQMRRHAGEDEAA